jgi:hypothetical protein
VVLKSIRLQKGAADRKGWSEKLESGKRAYYQFLPNDDEAGLKKTSLLQLGKDRTKELSEFNFILMSD